MFSVCLYVLPHTSLQPMLRVRTAEAAFLPREPLPSSNSAQASYPGYDEIKKSSNYRTNTISFPLPSTRWQHTYQKG